MGLIFGYLFFLGLYISANGSEVLYDLSNPISFVNILFLSTVCIVAFAGGNETEEEAEERRRKIQEQGKQLKERYQQTLDAKDYRAWIEWCVRFNGGKEN